MATKYRFFYFVLCIILLQSCSVNTKTTYYKDTASSMESNILIDQSMLSMLQLSQNSPDEIQNSAGINLKELTTDWKSLYDLQKNGKLVFNDKNAQVLKKVQLKMNKKQGELSGISLKYDKLLPSELSALFEDQSSLKKIPLQEAGKWDGKQLIIDTEKFNTSEFFNDLQNQNSENKSNGSDSKSDSLQRYGKQMVSGMMGMMRMFNLNFSNTITFQKPIKSIVGKHDFVQQIDKKTIQINVRTNDLLDEGKKLKNKDKQIVITTE